MIYLACLSNMNHSLASSAHMEGSVVYVITEFLVTNSRTWHLYLFILIKDF